MGFFARALGRTVATATLAGLVTTSSIVFGPLSQSAQGDRLTATTGVNLRSGPGLTYPIVGGLSTGQRITALGNSADGWTPVDLNGRKVYVASRYVSGDTGAGASAVSGSAGTAVTTANLNVRTGPSTSYAVVTTLGKGATVSLTGTTSGAWTQIARDGHSYWVSTVYLSTSAGSSSGGSAGTGTASGSAYTTTTLNIRTGPSTSYAVVTTLAKGTKVTTTGVEQNGWTQVLYNGATRWASSSYLTSSGASASQPAPSTVTGSGTLYATAAVNVRTGPSTSYAVVTTLAQGQSVSSTGKTSNGWTEVVWQGASRWVSSQYLSSRNPGTSTTIDPASVSSSIVSAALPGSVGLSGLVTSGKKIVNLVEARWPVVGPYYGVRVEPGSDHNDGHAVDCMIPNWSGANKVVGDEIAAYLQAHASELGISYIIWRQHIWSVARSSEGWRYMADRGSNTANHYDHVHVSVN